MVAGGQRPLHFQIFMVIDGELNARLATRKILSEVTRVLLIEGVDRGRRGLVVSVLAAVAQHGAAHLGSTLTLYSAKFLLINFLSYLVALKTSLLLLSGARASTGSIHVSTFAQICTGFLAKFPRSCR